MYHESLSAPATTTKSTSLWLATLASIVFINLPGFITALLGPILLPTLPVGAQYILNVGVFLLCPLAVFGLLAHHQSIRLAQCANWLGLAQRPTRQSLAIAATTGLAITVIGGVLASLLGQQTEQTGLNLMTSHSTILGTISLFIMIVIASPWLEEMVFRGWLWRHASQTRLGPFGAALMTSIIFTVLHITPGVQSVSLLSIFSLAMIAAWLRHHFVSLWPALVLHGTFNASQLLGLLWLTS